MGNSKPRVYWDGYFWRAEIDHGSWWDGHQFASWERALDHALWLGLTNGVGWKDS